METEDRTKERRECKGCTFYEDCWFIDIQKCPCRLCLVKVICDEACDLLMKFEKTEFVRCKGVCHEVYHLKEYKEWE